MKKILIMAALGGLLATGSYAQDKDCTCKKTSATKKTLTTRVVTRVPNQPSPTCFMDKKKNVGIPGCDEVMYSRGTSYSGYYPKKKATKTTVSTKTTTAVDAETQDCDVPAVKTAMVYTYRAPEPPQPCYTYATKSNIVVKQCPDKLYEKAPAYAPIEYNRGNVYMGYYPADNTKDPTLMENRPLEGVHFPGDELSYWGSNK